MAHLVSSSQRLCQLVVVQHLLEHGRHATNVQPYPRLEAGALRFQVSLYSERDINNNKSVSEIG